MDWLAQLKMEIMRRAADMMGQHPQHMDHLKPLDMPNHQPMEYAHPMVHGITVNPRLAAMQAAPFDTSGMDPEMAALMQGEEARKLKERAVYAPQTLGR